MVTNAEDEILTRATLTRDLIADLPMVSRFVDGAARAWEVSQSVSGTNDQKVQSIFLDDDATPGDAYVYAISTTGGMNARYTINRHDAGSAREYMSDEAFMDEVAAEMQALALEKGAIEECPDEECGGVNPADATTCVTCGRKLEEDEEPEEPEDGAGEVPEGVGVTAVPTVVPSATEA